MKTLLEVLMIGLAVSWILLVIVNIFCDVCSLYYVQDDKSMDYE